MPSSAHGSARKGAVAIALLILGLACAALFRVLAGTEHHSYSSGAVAPQTWHLTQGKVYQLAVPGGVRALERRGIDVTAPRCTYAPTGAPVRSLSVTAEGSGTKATNVLATFVAPESGDIHVDCLGWGALFIDDADSATADLSGWMLVASVLALTGGFGLGVSALRSAGGDPDGQRGDEEIDRLVHLVHVRAENGDPAEATPPTG